MTSSESTDNRVKLLSGAIMVIGIYWRRCATSFWDYSFSGWITFGLLQYQGKIADVIHDCFWRSAMYFISQGCTSKPVLVGTEISNVIPSTPPFPHHRATKPYHFLNMDHSICMVTQDHSATTFGPAPAGKEKLRWILLCHLCWQPGYSSSVTSKPKFSGWT